MRQRDIFLPDVWKKNQPRLGFGLHPAQKKHLERTKALMYNRRLLSEREAMSGEQWMEQMFGLRVPLHQFYDPRHPHVFVIPRNRLMQVIDKMGDQIGIMQLRLPFSSTDFFTDYVWGDVYGDVSVNPFHALYLAQAFHRLGGISQLGYLVPPRPEYCDPRVHISFFFPTFPHTRWIHCLMTGLLMEVTLARQGFAFTERAPVVLAASCHDIAMPAGGDSAQRIKELKLNEEDNFSWVLRHEHLDKAWQVQFGFDFNQAAKWVKGQGLFGKLIDVFDKISYTALDCYYLGRYRDAKVRRFCQRHPLVIDVWQDVRFTPDKQAFGFINPERLYQFLFLRALEHFELLRNPYSRVMDFYIEKIGRKLLAKGLVDKKWFLTHTDEDLHWLAETYLPEENISYVFSPEFFTWCGFQTEEELAEFCQQMGDRVDHTEYIKPVSTGLDWLVFVGEKLVPLRQVLKPSQVQRLEKLASSVQGYYAYYRKLG